MDKVQKAKKRKGSKAARRSGAYPKYGDLDMRKNMMKSLGMNKVPPITPDSIDELSGVIHRETVMLKDYDLEGLLEDARRR